MDWSSWKGKYFISVIWLAYLINIKIERDEADYALFGFACTYARSKVAVCTSPSATERTHWWSKYPEKGNNQ